MHDQMRHENEIEVDNESGEDTEHELEDEDQVKKFLAGMKKQGFPK